MEEMTRLFNLDFQLLHDVVLMAIAVFFLFMMMSKLLFNPVRKMLADRREKIAGELSDAANDKKDAAALKADYEARLKNILKALRNFLCMFHRPICRDRQPQHQQHHNQDADVRCCNPDRMTKDLIGKNPMYHEVNIIGTRRHQNCVIHNFTSL